MRIYLVLAVELLELLCCFTGVESIMFEYPIQALRDGCRIIEPDSKQNPYEVKRCQLVDNIIRYFDANLIDNFIGSEQDSEFVDDLKSRSSPQKKLHQVRRMGADHSHTKKGILEYVREALEMYLSSTENDSKETLKKAARSFEHNSAQERQEDSLNKLMSKTQIRVWLQRVQFARKLSSKNFVDFLDEWSTVLTMDKDIKADDGDQLEPKLLPVRASLVAMGLTDVFMRLFWPFRFDISEMNQKLGIYGISSLIVTENIKSDFFKALEDIQDIKMPYTENEVILSFNHLELVKGMNRSKLVVFNEDFVKDEKHLFNEVEQTEITDKTMQAMALIERTSPELYESIVQLVSCFAFYKSENRKLVGGSTSSVLGVIWLDPSAGEEWKVPFYAEMIVHEFIHTHLFYAELVHGTYTKDFPLSHAKVVSAIRKELRDYDRSLHAAYVAAGLATFHARAGYLDRAEELTTTLLSSVEALAEVNEETGVLDKSGTAILEFLMDYMALTKMETN